MPEKREMSDGHSIFFEVSESLLRFRAAQTRRVLAAFLCCPASARASPEVALARSGKNSPQLHRGQKLGKCDKKNYEFWGEWSSPAGVLGRLLKRVRS